MSKRLKGHTPTPLDQVLYAPIEPYNSGTLPVSGGHTIYYEESGNPEGKAALFIHGGPGGATGEKHRRFFDPSAYRIILFDQRGCGKSVPHASLEANTTWDIVEDMEHLRRHLGVDHWLIFGGSWGSTLGLAYAERHPSVVDELVLRGVALLRRTELEWFYQKGASQIFPDAWQEYSEYIPEAERGDFIRAYYARLNATDQSTCLEAARIWTRWEKRASYLLPNPEEERKVDDDAYALAFARLECHYFLNDGFFESERQILDGLTQLRGKTGIIVQGRYDMVCPAVTAWEVHQEWPGSELRIVPGAGHSAFEVDIAKELIRATDRLRPK